MRRLVLFLVAAFSTAAAQETPEVSQAALAVAREFRQKHINTTGQTNVCQSNTEQVNVRHVAEPLQVATIQIEGTDPTGGACREIITVLGIGNREWMALHRDVQPPLQRESSPLPPPGIFAHNYMTTPAALVLIDGRIVSRRMDADSIVKYLGNVIIDTAYALRGAEAASQFGSRAGWGIAIIETRADKVKPESSEFSMQP